MVGQAIDHAVVVSVPFPPKPVAFIVERRRRSLLLVEAGDGGEAIGYRLR
jgi:hypothetical protein